MTEPLAQGVYESLRTVRLDAALARLADLTALCEPLAEAEAPHVLGRHVGDVLTRTLAAERDPNRRLMLVNDLLGRVQQVDADVHNDEVVAPGEQRGCSVATPASPRAWSGAATSRGLRWSKVSSGT